MGRVDGETAAALARRSVRASAGNLDLNLGLGLNLEDVGVRIGEEAWRRFDVRCGEKSNGTIGGLARSSGGSEACDGEGGDIRVLRCEKTDGRLVRTCGMV